MRLVAKSSWTVYANILYFGELYVITNYLICVRTNKVLRIGVANV